MNKPLKIAITGGIGSGKSMASEFISSLGFTVHSCDEMTTALYQDREIRKKLNTLFPTAVGGAPNYDIDRVALSSLVFNDKVAHKLPSDTVTSLIIDKMDEILRSATKTVFIEVPLLFESNCQDKFDKVIVISRKREDRIKSVIKRSNLTEKQVESRMNAQVDYDKMDLSKYIVIKNDGNKQSFIDKLKLTLTDLQLI